MLEKSVPSNTDGSSQPDGNTDVMDACVDVHNIQLNIISRLI